MLWTDREHKVNALKNEGGLLRAAGAVSAAGGASDTVLFEADFQTQHILQPEFQQAFGLAPLAEKILDIQELMPGVHPEDHATLQRLYVLVITARKKRGGTAHIGL